MADTSRVHDRAAPGLEPKLNVGVPDEDHVRLHLPHLLGPGRRIRAEIAVERVARRGMDEQVTTARKSRRQPGGAPVANA